MSLLDLTGVSLSFAGSNIRMVNFDLPSVLGLYDSAPSSVDQAPGRIWAVHEQVTAAHAKLGFEFEAGVPFHGSLGLRVVHAKQWSDGLLWNPVTKASDPTTGGTSYTATTAGQIKDVYSEIGTHIATVTKDVELTTPLAALAAALMALGFAGTLVWSPRLV